MRRILLIAVLAAGATGIALGAAAGDDREGRRYTLELDTAYGLVDGGDLKIAGVRAGVIERMRLDRRTKRALVDIRIDERGFGGLRRDVRCRVRPQSLLGEYFVDCEPGTASRVLPDGSTVPVERTEGTVAPDLLTNVLRRPYQERLRILLSSLGAGVAGNGERLNATIRRAVPALRQTDRVLALLARQEDAIDGLVRDADTVLGEVDRRRTDVGRFVAEVGGVAEASAARRRELGAAIAATPRFLDELTPTMRALGQAAAEGAPTLRSLRAGAGEVRRLLRALGPVADAAGPTLRSLGRAADAGRPALRPVRERVRELRPAASGAPELLGNLAIILEHLDNREFAAEEDARSPGGKGFTTLEGLLRYSMYQALAVNAYDAESHLLNIGVFPSETCGRYTDLGRLRSHPQLEADCSIRLGPNAVGITLPDPSRPAGAEDRARAGGDGSRTARRRGAARPSDEAAGGRSDGGAATGSPAPTPGRPQSPIDRLLGDATTPVPAPALPALPDPADVVRDPAGSLPPVGQRPTDEGRTGLLDFLLG
jgi:virulence factor Mce-like protein